MSARKKSIELVNRFQNEVGMFSKEAKQCALICVDEILKLYKENWNIDNIYWQQVKEEMRDL
jgi:hypothetical protein